MNITELSPAQLRRAASIKQKISVLEVELGRILGATGRGSDGVAPKRSMSVAARKRIAAAQRARWAKLKVQKSPVKPTRKRSMSAEARAKLSAMAKERWTKAKASGKKRL